MELCIFHFRLDDLWTICLTDPNPAWQEVGDLFLYCTSCVDICITVGGKQLKAVLPAVKPVKQPHLSARKRRKYLKWPMEDAIIAYDGLQSWMTNSLMQSSQVDLSSKGKFFQLHSLWLWCWGHYFLEGILPQRKNKVAKTCSPLFWARISITVNCLKWLQREEVVNYN